MSGAPAWMAPWLPVAAAFAAALLTRGAGIVLSGRVEPETPVFNWFACVGQALVGGLMVRAIFLPTSALAETPTLDRAIAIAVGFAVFFLSKQRLLFGTFAGVGTLALLVAFRGIG
jgi:branched-subunit amino acid transport protein